MALAQLPFVLPFGPGKRDAASVAGRGTFCYSHQFANHHSGGAPQDLTAHVEVRHPFEGKVFRQLEVGPLPGIWVLKVPKGDFQDALYLRWVRYEMWAALHHAYIGVDQKIAHRDIELCQLPDHRYGLAVDAYFFFGFPQGSMLHRGVFRLIFAAREADLPCMTVIGIVGRPLTLNEDEVPAFSWHRVKECHHPCLTGIGRGRGYPLADAVCHLVLCLLAGQLLLKFIGQGLNESVLFHEMINPANTGMVLRRLQHCKLYSAHTWGSFLLQASALWS